MNTSWLQKHFTFLSKIAEKTVNICLENEQSNNQAQILELLAEFSILIPFSHSLLVCRLTRSFCLGVEFFEADEPHSHCPLPPSDSSPP
jgi:hypothetical protein